MKRGQGVREKEAKDTWLQKKWLVRGSGRRKPRILGCRRSGWSGGQGEGSQGYLVAEEVVGREGVGRGDGLGERRERGEDGLSDTVWFPLKAERGRGGR